MKFCDNELGINGATIAENLHFVCQGLMPGAFSQFLAQKHTHKSGKPSASIAKKPKRARHTTSGIDHDADMEDGSCDEHTDCDENNSVKESDTEDDNLFKPPSSVLLSQNSVFTKAIREYFDCLVKKFGQCLQHQSDHLFARAYFPSGIT